MTDGEGIRTEREWLEGLTDDEPLARLATPAEVAAAGLEPVEWPYVHWLIPMRAPIVDRDPGDEHQP